MPDCLWYFVWLVLVYDKNWKDDDELRVFYNHRQQRCSPWYKKPPKAKQKWLNGLRMVPYTWKVLFPKNEPTISPNESPQRRGIMDKANSTPLASSLWLDMTNNWKIIKCHTLVNIFTNFEDANVNRKCSLSRPGTWWSCRRKPKSWPPQGWIDRNDRRKLGTPGRCIARCRNICCPILWLSSGS